MVAFLDLPEQLLNHQYFWLHLIKMFFTSRPKKYRNKKEKSLQMKEDVGMVCQKVHKQGRIKVMVSIQSRVPTSLLLCEKMQGWMRLCILTITIILPCLCTFWHAIPTSPFIFNDFSFLYNTYSYNLCALEPSS